MAIGFLRDTVMDPLEIGSIHIVTISMELSILHLRGYRSKFIINCLNTRSKNYHLKSSVFSKIFERMHGSPVILTSFNDIKFFEIRIKC